MAVTKGCGATPNEADREANEGKGHTKPSHGKTSVLPPGNRDRYDQSEGCQECDGAGAAGGSSLNAEACTDEADEQGFPPCSAQGRLNFNKGINVLVCLSFHPT